MQGSPPIDNSGGPPQYGSQELAATPQSQLPVVLQPAESPAKTPMPRHMAASRGLRTGDEKSAGLRGGGFTFLRPAFRSRPLRSPTTSTHPLPRAPPRHHPLLVTLPVAAMILYDEKVDGAEKAQEPTTTPHVPRTLSGSPISSVDSRLGTGLLHRYLQLYEETTDRNRRTNSGDTLDDESTSPLFDEPPPYSDSSLFKDVVDQKDEESRPRTSFSPTYGTFPRLLKSPPPAITAHASPAPLQTPLQPIAGPSNSNHIHAGDIEGTWVLSSDPDAYAASTSAGLPAAGRETRLETTEGDIRVSILARGHRSRRCRIDALTHRGSVHLSFAPDKDSAAARIHVKAASKAGGSVTVRFPPNFTGVVRTRSSPPAANPFDPRLGPITLISKARSHAAATEYFVGDVTREGYVKGLDDEWMGNLVEVEACDGPIFLLSDSPEPVEGPVDEPWVAWSRILGQLRTFFDPIWRRAL